MKDKILFEEKQKFTQWYVWLPILIPLLIVLFGFVKQVLLGQTFGKKPVTNIELIMLNILVIGIALLFYSFKLETVIKESGIYVRFFPFQSKFKKYDWSEIESAKLKKYSPLQEFGGWGYRNGAFNVSGNMGLQLVFKDQKKLLIGTNNPTSLEAALKARF